MPESGLAQTGRKGARLAVARTSIRSKVALPQGQGLAEAEGTQPGVVSSWPAVHRRKLVPFATALLVPFISFAPVRHGKPCQGVGRTSQPRRSAGLSAGKSPVPHRLAEDERPRSGPASTAATRPGERPTGGARRAASWEAAVAPGGRSNTRSSRSRTGAKPLKVNRPSAAVQACRVQSARGTWHATCLT